MASYLPAQPTFTDPTMAGPVVSAPTAQNTRDQYAAALSPAINFQRSRGAPGGLAMGRAGQNPLVAQNPWQQGQGGQPQQPTMTPNALTGLFAQV